MTVQTNDNKFACAKWIVDSGGPGVGATHTTIAAALTSASAGDTIFVKPGTYTEDITLKSDITISAFGHGDASTGEVVLKGKISAGTTANATIQNIGLETNADNLFSDIGSGSGTVSFESCNFQLKEAQTIFNSTNNGRTIICNSCTLNLGIASIKVFAWTGTGSINFRYCVFSSSGSETSSTISAGTVRFIHTIGGCMVTTSGTAGLVAQSSEFSKSNQVAITHGGSSDCVLRSVQFSTGTAQCMVVSAGSNVVASRITLNSTDNTPISGTGTIWYDTIGFVQAGNRTIQPTRSGGALNVNQLILDQNLDLPGSVFTYQNLAFSLGSTATVNLNTIGTNEHWMYSGASTTDSGYRAFAFVWSYGGTTVIVASQVNNSCIFENSGLTITIRNTQAVVRTMDVTAIRLR